MLGRTWTRVALAALLAACGGGGTGGTDAGHAGTGACGDIVDACHEVDTGTGPLADCHDLGHDGVQAMCEARRDECVALCEAAHHADGGAHPHDGGAHADGDGGGPPADGGSPTGDGGP